ncbi:Hypothetical protein SRAE_2000246600 [Strongyloides ratti]|uniref:Uncharacterized protein n=1 Tax=Strongyloides ratti TaxID=34506 RepID=A0A090MYU7_STRRB|nr:Hypothetical protein SRAE_2000246600 [Strongyloides ratti]CEF67804.1 Hypothetical protein SRAE_2000246600 [Strongyloides ratti]
MDNKNNIQSTGDKISQMCKSVENFEIILQETCIEHEDNESLKAEYFKSIQETPKKSNDTLPAKEILKSN